LEFASPELKHEMVDFWIKCMEEKK